MSETIYACLLRLYPTHFRRAYGDEALQLLRDRARDERGFLPRLRLWMDLLSDLAVSVPRAYRHVPPVVLAAANGMPSFHILDGEAPTFGSLFYGGVASCVIYSGILFAATHGPSYFPLPGADGQHSPHYALSSTSSPPPQRSSQRSGEDDESPSGGPGGGNHFRPKTFAALGSLFKRVIPSKAETPSVAKKEFKAFDVASVRENKTSDPIFMNFALAAGDYGYVANGGYLHVTNLPLSGYIGFAYNVYGPQRSVLFQQMPDWVKSTKYDIEARVEGNPSKDDMRAMMRTLLTQRFKLTLHQETHEAAVFDLVLAKQGKIGPTLKPHPSEDPSCLQGRLCGAIRLTPSNPLELDGRNIPLTFFADSVAGYAGRPVIDKTGLVGNYDFTLEFGPSSNAAPDAKPDETGVTFPQAITEQMGLKLTPAKGQVETYVLDHVERPSEN